MKARKPLADAHVEVRPVKGKPGSYEAVGYLKPHYPARDLVGLDAAGRRDAQEGLMFFLGRTASRGLPVDPTRPAVAEPGSRRPFVSRQHEGSESLSTGERRGPLSDPDAALGLFPTPPGRAVLMFDLDSRRQAAVPADFFRSE